MRGVGEAPHEVGEDGGRVGGITVEGTQRDVDVGRTGCDEIGDGRHAAGEVGPAVVAALDRQGCLYLQCGGITAGCAPRFADSAGAVGDVGEGRAHDRDPCVAPTDEPFEVAGM